MDEMEVLQSVQFVRSVKSLRVGAFGLFTQEAIREGPEILGVFNPVAVPQGKRLILAPRLDTLAGKKIVLFWNSKPGGDLALRRAEDRKSVV